ncbi:MAG: M16 family metallopeptidase [Chakrabartia sp.]
MSRLSALLLLAGATSLAAKAPSVPASKSVPVSASAAPQPSSDVPWLYRGSDIPIDRHWIFGELPNGLRYALRRNGVPPGQVSIRVAVDAGSLMERPNEQGYAHFLEHLSFRGSKYVADGEAKRVWQRLGATFGSDSNAQTSPTQTIYSLDLPQARPEALAESLRILSGMMSAPTISPAEVEAERRTVMAEARERDGAQMRVQNAIMKLFFVGQPLATRTPIGTSESLAAATAETLRAFHDRWYRPDNVVLAISGDVDPAVLAPLIRSHFGTWAPTRPGPAPKADFGMPKPDAPKTAFIVEPGLPNSISLAWIRRWIAKDDTIALNQGRLVGFIAQRILNRRLETLARSGGSFLDADVQQDDIARSADITQVAITPANGNWQAALQDVRAVIADATTRAPSQSEVDRETSEFKAMLDVQVETAGAEASAKQADDLIEAVNIRETIASAEAARDIFAAMIGKFGPEDVREATAALFSGIGPRALLTSQIAEADGPAQLAAALAKPVAARTAAQDEKPVTFDQLPPLGTTGQIVKRKTIAAFDTEILCLSNGVRVLLGRSTSEAGRVYVQARFGNGLAGLPADRLTPAWAAPALGATGIGQLSQDAIERMTSGRQISLSFGVGEDAFIVKSITRPADLSDQLRLMATKFAMPGWDVGPVLRTRAAAVLTLQTANSSPIEVLNRNLGALLRPGDVRWKVPSPADAETLTPDAFRRFWEPELTKSPIELLVFGDFDRATALNAIVQSFGALAIRPAQPIRPITQLPVITPNAAPVRLTHKGAADQAVAVLVWPTGGGTAGVSVGRRLDILAAIFADRLFEQFREGEGASYSPDVTSQWPQSFPSGGTFSVSAQVKPESLPAFFARAKSIAADLAANPVSADELRRALVPMIQRLSRASTGNSFWMAQLAGASNDRRRINNVRRWRKDLERIRPQDIQQLARKFLRPNTSFSAVVIPETLKP